MSNPTTAPSHPICSLPVILGSSSKWRAKLLRAMGIPIVSQMNPDIDEYAVQVEGQASEVTRNRSKPDALSMAVARAKAKHLLAQIASTNSDSSSSSSNPTTATSQPHLLITSDQVAFFDGEIREKPRDAEQCRQWFQQYSSKPIEVCNAVVVTNTLTGVQYEGVAFASQLFNPVPMSILDGLIETGDILGCCGGFLVDDDRITPYLADRHGTEDEIIGLPKNLLTQLLQQAEEDQHKQKQTTAATTTST